MVAIRQWFVPQSKYGLKCPNPMTPRWITVHNTANDASAHNEISYMRDNNLSTSFHFAVDDKEIVQGIPLSRNAWHCTDGTHGEGNRFSIGIEICYSKSGGTRYYQAEGKAIELIAHLLHERGWGIDRVVQHYKWYQGKSCPHRIRAEGRWNDFLQAIQRELNALKGDDIDMNTAKELKEQIDSLQSYIRNLERQLEEVSNKVANKQDKKSHFREPSPWAREVWDEKVFEGYFDGSRPQDYISRQEVAVIIKRITDNVRQFITDPVEQKLRELEDKFNGQV